MPLRAHLLGLWPGRHRAIRTRARQPGSPPAASCVATRGRGADSIPCRRERANCELRDVNGAKEAAPPITGDRSQSTSASWCRRPDSNRHGLPHTPLKRTCLPIPPRRHGLLLGHGARGRRLRRRLTGAAGTGAAGAGADFAAGAFSGRTEARGRASRIVRSSATTMKATNPPVVSLCSRVVAPRAPKAVCVPPPPKAPAMSAPFPCWTRTTRIRKKQMNE